MTGSNTIEIYEAVRKTPVWAYREYGLVVAIVWVMTMPVVIPIAAIFYFSIGAEKRELLDESEEFVEP